MSPYIQAKVIDLAAYVTGHNPSRITGASRFDEDLGADSLDKMELLIAIEEDFKIVLRDQDMSDIKDIDGLVRLIETKVSEG